MAKPCSSVTSSPGRGATVARERLADVAAVRAGLESLLARAERGV